MQQRLCTTLYDSMRPLVIRVQHLETLAELCAIFRVEMLEDVVAHNSVLLKKHFLHTNHTIFQRLVCLRYTVCIIMLAFDWIASVAYDVSAFGAVCSAVLADVQERFVYRAHTYVRDEILNYRPAPGDLAYPHKLLMMQVTRPDPTRSASLFSAARHSHALR